MIVCNKVIILAIVVCFKFLQFQPIKLQLNNKNLKKINRYLTFECPISTKFKLASLKIYVTLC